MVHTHISSAMHIRANVIAYHQAFFGVRARQFHGLPKYARVGFARTDGFTADHMLEKITDPATLQLGGLRGFEPIGDQVQPVVRL